MKQISRLLLSAFFLACAIPALAGYQSIDKIIVIVDDDVISQADLDREITIFSKNLASRQTPQLPSEKEIRQYVLDNLIIKSLQMQLALKSGITITDEQLGQAVSSIAEHNGFGNLQDFRQKLASEGIGFEEMREKIRQDLMLQRLQQSHLRNRIQVTEQEINNFLGSAEGKRVTSTQYKVSHILLAVDSGSPEPELADAEKKLAGLRQLVMDGKLSFEEIVSGKKIDGYNLKAGKLDWAEIDGLPSLFAQVVKGMGKGEISMPIQSGAGWHLVKLADIKGGSNIVHQTSVRHILVKPSEIRTEEQAKKLIDSLHARLQKDEDFSLLAKEYSEDPGSALQGGDLGWSKPGQFVPEFDDVMGRLKDGETSQPFHSRYGWHIMQKIGERDHDMTTEGWKNQAYEAIYEKKFAAELEAWLQKIRDEAFIEFK